MLNKINTLVRLFIVGLLIYPMPLVGATEVTVNEGFADSTYEAGLTISGGTIYCDEQNQYGTTGCSLLLSNGTYTFTFSSDIYVYEVGFIVGAVNNAYSVKYYYSDGTDETINKSGQDISNYSTMYDDFYKSFTDYNNNEANTDKYITKFDVVISDASLFDTLYWQYDDADATGSFGTTTTTTIPRTIGTPTDVSVKFDTVNGNDGFLVSWSAPTDGGYSPERYAIFFGEGECCQWGVGTGNVGDENALNTYYFFSMNYLTAIFGSQYGDFYWQVRSDNDTEALYSGWSTTVHMNSTPPTTTTSTTTTTTTLPPPPPPAPEPEPEPEKIVVVMDDGTKAEYTETEIADGTSERDNERKANEEKWGCYVTNIALERGDCEAYNEAISEPEEEIITEEVVDEKIIEEDIKDEVLEEEVIIKDEVIEDEIEIKDEEIIKEVEVDILPEDEILPIEDEVVVEDDILVVVEEDITDKDVVEIIPEKSIEEIIIEDIEEIKEVDIKTIDAQDTEQKEIIKEVIKEVVKPEVISELSQEQKHVVAEVLGFKDDKDVEIIAVQAEKEETIAMALDEYVDRAIENKDVENYTLADVVTEIQVEQFLDNPLSVILDIDLKNFDIKEIGNDMTNDQKEKAQEVVIPIIIASQIIASVTAVPIRRIT